MINVENIDLPSYDVFQQASGAFKAVTREITTFVADSILNISLQPQTENPKLSAIRVKLVRPHLAHAVAGGPYSTVDVNGNGSAGISVDGSQSHTHGIGLNLQSFEWKVGSKVLGTTEKAVLTLPVGAHDVTLKVVDSEGNDSVDTTSVTILASGFPDIASISPESGPLSGGDQVSIKGSGFLSASGVQFGQTFLSNKDVNILNDGEITVSAPNSSDAVPVSISVTSAAGSSNAATFTYIGNIPIKFKISKLVGFPKPTVVRFGPNGDLYAGNLDGKVVSSCQEVLFLTCRVMSIGELARFKLDSTFTKVVSQTISKVANGRFVMGIAFDPTETADTINPTVYITTSKAFHGEDRDSYGNAVNGKVQKVTGANLDSVSDVITGKMGVVHNFLNFSTGSYHRTPCFRP